MKTLMSLLLITLVASVSSAQPREGKNRELSLSGGLQNTSSGSSSGSSTSFLISPRLGFFVHKGLELEPEAVLMLGSGADPVYIVNANVSYNFLSSHSGVPFLLLGYGRANTVPFFNVPLLHAGFGVGVVNFGAGVKIYLNTDTALRLEYRFQRFYGKGDRTVYASFSYTEEIDSRIQTVQFGFSILL